jgi:ribonucleoside-diphosphate reductase alpha subunit
MSVQVPIPTMPIPTIVKRSGKAQNFSTRKTVRFLQELSGKVPRLTNIDAELVLSQATMGINLSTVALAEHLAEICAAMAVRHWEYGTLGGRVLTAMLHRQTPSTFTESMMLLQDTLSKTFVQCCQENREVLNEMIEDGKDYQYNVMGIRTLQRSYLLKKNGIIVERPQYMLMRVAVALHGNDLEMVRQTYASTSSLEYTHATPTLFHAGLAKQQLASCFLMTMVDDSIEGIFETLKRCALISKGAGGIGLSVSNIRAGGSRILGTNGVSNGLTPMLRVFNDTARYVDQGGGKRKGSFAIFLEPHHPDILDFLELKKNHGVDAEKARDLFYGLWISDLFMERVKDNQPWSVICPTQCPALQNAVGEAYVELYLACEEQGNVVKTFASAREVWFAILDAQIETGTPYMMYKDHCNRKSNQQNLGTIRGSNLCCEIVEYTSPEETAVCTLASISLSDCVINNSFDFGQLERVARLVTVNLNKTIDVNWYPIEQARHSNMKHRPIGIGVQGLADVFQQLDMPYDSDKARQLNKHIFETIYYAALSESVNLAKEFGAYASFKGSPFSQGRTQIELWGQTTTDERYPWSTLRQDLVQYGARNSLLTAPMPTASTAQIMGNTESFEPRTSNLYTRRVLSGEYIIINKYLQEKLSRLGIWSEKMGRMLIEHRGSVQNIPGIPAHIKKTFRTVWEISQRSIIDMAADRGIYIDQSQSLNLHIEEASRAVLTSVHFHTWSKGLKTGQYYLRTQPKTKAIQFTVATKRQKLLEEEQEDCLMCGA